MRKSQEETKCMLGQGQITTTPATQATIKKEGQRASGSNKTKRRIEKETKFHEKDKTKR